MTKNFSRKELECKCGCGLCNMDEIFLIKLQILRDFYGKPIIINSAFRCFDHNRSLGSSDRSQHVLGRACDLKINNDSERYEILNLAFNLNFTGIATGKGFVHLDLRSGESKSWLY